MKRVLFLVLASVCCVSSVQAQFALLSGGQNSGGALTSFNEGTWLLSIGATKVVQRAITSTNNEAPVEIPADFVLEGNYPNPFNPQTTIRFDLPQPEHVTLTVYDTMGRMVRVLRDQSLSAGSYEVPFEADLLPSGVYFYRLEAGQFRMTRSMTLMR